MNNETIFTFMFYFDMFYFAEVKTPEKQVFVNGSHLLLHLAVFSQVL